MGHFPHLFASTLVAAAPLPDQPSAAAGGDGATILAAAAAERGRYAGRVWAGTAAFGTPQHNVGGRRARCPARPRRGRRLRHVFQQRQGQLVASGPVVRAHPTAVAGHDHITIAAACRSRHPASAQGARRHAGASRCPARRGGQ